MIKWKMGYMILDIKTLALINFIIQLMLLILLFFAASLAVKRDFKRHCNILRVAVPIQFAAILIFMLPNFQGYKISNISIIDFVKILHHLLGSLLIGMWIYLNLVYSRYIRWWKNFRVMMRIAFVLWILTFLIGAYIYISLYYSSG